MKKLPLFIVILFAVVTALYINLWYYLDSKVSNLLEEINNTEKDVNFAYSSYGFPFSVNYKISNFKAKIFWPNEFSEFEGGTKKDSSSTNNQTIKEEVKNLTFSEDLLIIFPFFSDHISIIFPKETYLKDDAGEGVFTSKYLKGKAGVIKIFHEVNKLDLLLTSIGLKEIEESDIRESFKGLSYEDGGAVAKNSSGEVLVESGGFFVKGLYDEENNSYKFSLNMNYQDFNLGKAYFDWYRSFILNGAGENPYAEKLIDYVINFSQSSGPVSGELSLNLSGKHVKGKVGYDDNQSIEKIDLKSFKIQDRLGETSIVALITKPLNGEEDDNKNYKINHLDYKMENFEAVFNRYLVLLSNSINLAVQQDLSQASPMASMFQAMVPKQDEVYRLIPVIKKSIKDFFAQINAVEGKNLKIIVKQGENDPMPTINDLPIMQVMMVGQSAFTPVIKAYQEIQRNRF